MKHEAAKTRKHSDAGSRLLYTMHAVSRFLQKAVQESGVPPPPPCLSSRKRRALVVAVRFLLGPGASSLYLYLPLTRLPSLSKARARVFASLFGANLVNSK